MNYQPVGIYDIETGAFLGYGIKRHGVAKLQSTNVYTEGEEAKLNEQLGRLNQDVDLKAHWPHPQDPEVQALLDDKSFLPIEYTTAEVVDDDSSYYAYTKTFEVDAHGNPTGNLVDSEELDEEASVIVFKIAQVPKRPTDVMWRIKAACEQVAKQRAGC